jgi:hypothetical protein
MKIKIKLVIIFLVAVGFLFTNSALAQKVGDDQSEKIILAFIEAKGLDVQPHTEAYTRLMKGILLGEYPELTNENSTFVSKETDRKYLIDYAAQIVGSQYATKTNRLLAIDAQAIPEASTALSLRGAEQLTLSATYISPSRAKAIDYAYSWTLQGSTHHNPDYPDFGFDDCTNYVSQVLKAGGFVEQGTSSGCRYEDTDTEWYVKANPSPPLWCWGDFRDWEWSTSWSATNQFRSYFADQNNFAEVPGWTNDVSTAKYHLSPGDVIQLQAKDGSGNWVTYHTMVVTDENESEIYVTYHSNAQGLDEVDKPLSTISTGPSQRYLLIKIFYREIFIPVVVSTGGVGGASLNAQNAYPAPLQSTQQLNPINGKTIEGAYPAP